MTARITEDLLSLEAFLSEHANFDLVVEDARPEIERMRELYRASTHSTVRDDAVANEYFRLQRIHRAGGTKLTANGRSTASEADMRSLEKWADDLVGTGSAARRMIADLRSRRDRLAEAEAELARQHALVEELNGNIALLTGAHSELEGLNRLLEEELKAFTKKLDDARAAAEAEIMGLTGELTNAKAAIGLGEQRESGLKNDLSAANREIALGKERETALVAERDGLKNVLGDLTTRFDNAQRVIAAERNRVLDLEQALARKEAELNGILGNLRKLISAKE